MRGRYILIVGAALILAISLYFVLDISDSKDVSETEAGLISEPVDRMMTGVQPASFLDVQEFQDGARYRLQLSGRAEPNGVIVISNRGQRYRQVRVNERGQWDVTLDVNDEPMALEALLYMTEEGAPIRSEETVFRIPIPKTDKNIDSDESEVSDKDRDFISEYKKSALIMVTAPGSPSRIVQSPYGEAPTSGPLSLSVIDYDYQGGVIITGTSSVPGRVRFSAQNVVIGETGIGVGGRWNFIAGRLLPRMRLVNIRAELIPAAGTLNAPEDRISLTVPFNFLPILQEEDTDGSGALSVNIEPKQWHVRRTLIGGGGQSTAIFAPNAAIN
jgi:hypothetical protein